MVDRIGEAAGEIWRALDKGDGEMTVTELKNQTKLSTNLVHQGLGWLAREDKIDFSVEGKTTKVRLKISY